MVAVLIFSMGVLTIVSLQSMSVRQSSQAKYRADAMLLANDLVSQMWVTDRQFSTLSTNFVAGGAAYDIWLDTVTAALPGAADFPPEVTVDSIPGGGGAAAAPSSRVTVVLQWKPPSAAPGDAANNLTMVSQIK